MMRVLLDYIPNINSINEDGDTLIILASRNGYVEIVSALLDKGKLKAYYFLIIRVKIVNRLSMIGSEVDIVDRRGWNSLHNAAHYGHREVVKKLLQSKLNQDCLTPDSGNSALHLAILEGHTDIVIYFIGYFDK